MVSGTMAPALNHVTNLSLVPLALPNNLMPKRRARFYLYFSEEEIEDQRD